MDRASLTFSETAIPVPARGLRNTLRDATFRSLRHRDYRLYFFGQFVSYIGSWMQSAALLWLVYEETGDPFWPPLMLVATVGPTCFLGPLGGLLADRYPKKAVIFASQCSFLLTALILVSLLANGLASPPALLLVAFVNGIIQAVDLPARLAYVPDLVPKADLINAVSLNSLLFNSARAIGPALAGILFLAAEFTGAPRPVLMGAMACFILNSVSYGAVLFALSRIRAWGESIPQTTRGRLFEGLHYLRTHPTLAGLLVLTGFVSIFGWPVLTLFPAYTKLVLGHSEKEYSILVSSLGFGALLGALTTATYGSVALRGVLLTVGSFLAALGVLGLAFVHSIGLAAGCSAALGAGLILFLSTGQSTLQLSLDEARRGRVMALWAMTLSASAPLGHLIAGKAAQIYPLQDVLLVMAAGAGGTAILVASLAHWGLRPR